MARSGKQRSFLALLLSSALVSACGENHVVTIPGEYEENSQDERDMRAGAQDMGVADEDMGQMDAWDMSFEDMRVDPPSRDMGQVPTEDMGAEIQDMGSPEDMTSTDPDDAYIGTACDANGRMGTCQRAAQCQAPNEHVPGFCPGSSAVRCCVAPGEDPPDMPAGMCDENAAPTPNPLVAQDSPIGSCPDGMTQIDADYCIDRFEASLVEITPNGDIPHSPYVNPGNKSVRAVSVEGAIPQGYITGDQAEVACQNAGKRLCTSNEWLLACQGAQTRTYPYGNTEQPGVCNAARANHPVVEYFGTSADWIWSELDNACINQLPDSLAKTGEHPGCVTPEGAFDMVGNLHEWVADASGTFRGGFYVDTYRNGNGCYYRTTAHNRQHWDYSTGFRCCANTL